MEVVNMIKQIDNDTATITLSFRSDQLRPSQNTPKELNERLQNYDINNKHDAKSEIEKSPTCEPNAEPCNLQFQNGDRPTPLTSVTDSANYIPARDWSGSPESDNSFPRMGDRRSSDSWTEGSVNAKDEDEEVTNAELGLSEDHFSQPDKNGRCVLQGHFCLSTIEELEMAIENCKEFILEAPEKSEKRKNLIKKLVQLRMKLQEAKDGPEVVPPDMKLVLGHHFVKKQIERPKHYCEKCTGIIWGMLQTWHQCIDCGFSCHGRCLNLIMRTCANVKVAENQTYLLDICPEVGLSAQNYRCAECRTHIMFTFPLRSFSCGWIPISSENTWMEPRLCDLNGLYYCPNCHWNSQAVIPARVLHNWDFEQQRVCRASKQFLRLMRKKAVINIQDVNPMLFSFVEELSLIKKLREEILVMKKYFMSCKEALRNKLLMLLSERQHFVDSPDIYSMQDLMDVQSGRLLEYLNRVHAQFLHHIKEDCQICRGQGFICELCDNAEVLFPFDNVAAVCPHCSMVFHTQCFLRRERKCPRCMRRQQRRASDRCS